MADYRLTKQAVKQLKKLSKSDKRETVYKTFQHLMKSSDFLNI
jgi:hypothetical protein